MVHELLSNGYDTDIPVDDEVRYRASHIRGKTMKCQAPRY